jgi:hypothetical protein
MSASKMHVFVITCHDLGRHLSCYGVASMRLPHLDLLAAAGARFEHAFCTAPRSGRSGHRPLPTQPRGAGPHPRWLRLRSALGGTTCRRAAGRVRVRDTPVRAAAARDSERSGWRSRRIPCWKGRLPQRATIRPSRGAPAHRAGALVPLANDR